MSERLTRERIKEMRVEIKGATTNLWIASVVRNRWHTELDTLCDMALAQAEQTEAAPVAAGVEERDRDWILAMAAALGPDSGYKIPIAPNPEPFKALFSALLSSREDKTPVPSEGLVERSNRIAGIMVEDSVSADNLAIALCTYFDRHIDRPENDPETEHGWGEWVEKKTNETLDRIAALLSSREAACEVLNGDAPAISSGKEAK